MQGTREAESPEESQNGLSGSETKEGRTEASLCPPTAGMFCGCPAPCPRTMTVRGVWIRCAQQCSMWEVMATLSSVCVCVPFAFISTNISSASVRPTSTSLQNVVCGRRRCWASLHTASCSWCRPGQPEMSIAHANFKKSLRPEL